jgi:paired amphipathic helix protein Sin3a
MVAFSCAGERDRSKFFIAQTKATRALKRVIHRHLTSDDSLTSSTIRSEGELGIRISLGTYKLFHERGTEWSVARSRGQEEERMLKDRARQREEDRRRRLSVVTC